MVDREQAILDAAERLIAEHGFHAVGVDLIGEEAGISGSAIYRHFSSKDEILGALFAAATAELLVRLGAVRDDPQQELEHLVDVHLDFTLERTRLAAIWQHEQRSLTHSHRRNFVRGRELYVQRWLTTLAAAFPGQKHEELVVAMNAAQSAIMTVAMGPRSVATSRRRAVVRAQVLAGLTALADSPSKEEVS
jgi:AcrR family transcriptional regulator